MAVDEPSSECSLDRPSPLAVTSGCGEVRVAGHGAAEARRQAAEGRRALAEARRALAEARRGAAEVRLGAVHAVAALAGTCAVVAPNHEAVARPHPAAPPRGDIDCAPCEDAALADAADCVLVGITAVLARPLEPPPLADVPATLVSECISNKDVHAAL